MEGISGEADLMYKSVTTALNIPEVLDMIYQKCDFKDIKTCRLVSRGMRSGAQTEFAKFACMRLCGSSEQGSNESEKVELADPREFRQFIITKNIPDMFLEKFKCTLTKLHLKAVSFESENDLQRLIFGELKALKDLGLIDVLVMTREKTKMDAAPHRDENGIPLVQKLTVQQTREEYQCGLDLFSRVNLADVIIAYKSCLKELHCPELNANCSFPSMDLFAFLRAHDISLTQLTTNLKTKQDVMSFKAYAITHGHHITHLNLMGHGSNRARVNSDCYILDVFGVSDQRDLGMYPVVPGREFTGLTHLKLSNMFVESWKFLQMTPNLVFLSLSDPSFTQHASLEHDVQQLELSFCNWDLDRDEFVTLSRVFPNLRSLEIKIREAKSIFHGFWFTPKLVRNARDFWPRLEHLKIDGMVSLFMARANIPRTSLGNGKGNEDMFMFSPLVKMINLKSFVLDGDGADNVYFGDQIAKRVFLSMPSLKTLRIRTCAMSEEVVNKLNSKLDVFTYCKRF